ncbi:MAG: efflux RND transporter periplasmic adaptor subunit [Puniceicoccales bacterium]|jgi:RND family efflux transporter MFP subunit|nr:efflux RND transporter periplasmic adaptor subunit [Puniceicoccales bacterium]
MKLKTVLQALVLLAVVIGSYFGVRELAIPEVEVEPVKRGTSVLSATGNVTVLPALEANLVATEKGVLSKFTYREGDLVKKDDLVAQIDSGRLAFDLTMWETDLERLKERLALGSHHRFNLAKLEKNLRNAKLLKEQGTRSENEIISLETEANVLRRIMELDTLDLEYAVKRTTILIAQTKNTLENYDVRAPFDGVIMTPVRVQGDLVFAGGAITKIASTKKLIKVEVNQDDLEAVRRSKRVIVNFFSFPNQDFEGTVLNLVPVGNSTTQRFTVFLKMEKLPEKLLSGQTGEASFIADERANALLIPARAITSNHVFVLNGDRLEKRKIQKGYTSITKIEILGGLKEGEFIVCKDVDQQRDGDRVRIKKTTSN